jgi:hypothetical protein
LKKEDHNKVHVPEESLGICTLAGSCQERGLLCEDHHQQTYRRHEEDKRDLWLKTTYIRIKEVKKNKHCNRAKSRRRGAWRGQGSEEITSLMQRRTRGKYQT